MLPENGFITKVDEDEEMKRYHLGHEIGRASIPRIIWRYTLLTSISIIFIIPLVWMIATAFKTPDQMYNQQNIFWPDPWTFENMISIFTTTKMARFVMNSVIVTALSMLGAIISTSLAAFAFARLKWKWRNTVFLLVFLMMMIPEQTIMIPQYLVFQKAKLVNTLWPLILPSWLAAGVGCPMYIFMLRQFIMTISPDIDEAAKIDGCGPFGIYARMIMPLLVPAIGSVLVFAFLGNWNNFLGALIYLNRENTFTIPIGIQYFKMQNIIDWNRLMCAALVSIFPALLVLFFGQKYLVKGVNLSASKG